MIRTRVSDSMVLAFSMLLVLAGCGDDGNDGGDAGGADTAATDTASQDTAPADTGAADTDAPDPDTGDDNGDTGQQLEMTELTYRRIDPGCPTGSCDRGVTINLRSSQIIKKENNSFTKELDSEDLADAKMKLHTDTIIAKMKNGWDCGGEPDNPDVEFEFEARVGDGFPAEKKIQDVTGCLQSGADAPDTDTATDIKDYMLGLREAYFQNN